MRQSRPGTHVYCMPHVPVPVSSAYNYRWSNRTSIRFGLRTRSLTFRRRFSRVNFPNHHYMTLSLHQYYINSVVIAKPTRVNCPQAVCTVIQHRDRAGHIFQLYRGCLLRNHRLTGQNRHPWPRAVFVSESRPGSSSTYYYTITSKNSVTVYTVYRLDGHGKSTLQNVSVLPQLQTVKTLRDVMTIAYEVVSWRRAGCRHGGYGSARVYHTGFIWISSMDWLCLVYCYITVLARSCPRSNCAHGQDTLHIITAYHSAVNNMDTLHTKQ